MIAHRVTQYLKLLLGFCIAFFTALFSGCGPGLQDYEEHIVDDFYLMRAHSDYKAIIKKENGRHITFVKPTVTNFLVAESRFILVSSVHYSLPSETEKATSTKAIEYWLIQVSENSVIGPLGKEALIQKALILGINNEFLEELFDKDPKGVSPKGPKRGQP